MSNWIRIAFVLSALLLTQAFARAQDTSAAPSAAAKPKTAQKSALEEKSTTGAERVEVDAIKEKYWARGDESELGVVQNRQYSKQHKLELSLFVGTLTTDPFLTVKDAGFSLGFHFNEYFSLHALAWKDFVSPSTALQTFQDTIHATTNYNSPKSYYGTEASASVIYGKLSVLGKAIIYYDLHLLAGVGMTGTDSGNDLTLSAGVGQQIFLTKYTSLRIDYRAMRYNETIIERVITSKLGQSDGDRTNWTHSITLGISFLFGGSSK